MQSSSLMSRHTSHMLVIKRVCTRSLRPLSLIGALSLVGLSTACNSAPNSSQGADKQQANQGSNSSASGVAQSGSAAAKTTAESTAESTAETKTKVYPLPSGEPAHSGETFEVYTPHQGAKDVLIIKSKSGYKINENYPHRATFSIGVEALKAQVDLKLKTLYFSIPDANLTKPGTSVTASFSVCDDKSCQVYSKNYKW